MTRHFIELDDVMRLSLRLAAQARRAGDESGACAIEEFASELAAEVQFTLYELDRNGSGNGSHP